MNSILFFDEDNRTCIIDVQKVGIKYIHVGNMKFNRKTLKLVKDFCGCLDGSKLQKA